MSLTASLQLTNPRDKPLSDAIRWWDLFLNRGSSQIFSAVKRKSTDARPHAVHVSLELSPEGRSKPRIVCSLPLSEFAVDWLLSPHKR
jgi:hypothetical protein